MLLFILGIFIIIVVGFILGFNIPNTNGLIWDFKGKQLISTVIGGIFIVLSCIAVVPTGHTGIISVFGTIKNNTLDAGLSFKAPWAKIITMDNRIQKVSGEMTGTTSDMQDVTAWQRGEIVFRSMTMEEIFTRLERKYPYTFVYSFHSLKSDRFNLTFGQNASIEEVMDIIARVTGNLDYKIVGDKCYLTVRHK